MVSYARKTTILQSITLCIAQKPPKRSKRRVSYFLKTKLNILRVAILETTYISISIQLDLATTIHARYATQVIHEIVSQSISFDPVPYTRIKIFIIFIIQQPNPRVTSLTQLEKESQKLLFGHGISSKPHLHKTHLQHHEEKIDGVGYVTNSMQKKYLIQHHQKKLILPRYPRMLSVSRIGVLLEIGLIKNYLRVNSI